MLNTTGQVFKCWLFKELMLHTIISNSKLNPAFYFNNTKNAKILKKDAGSQSQTDIYFQTILNLITYKSHPFLTLKNCFCYL